MNEKVKINSGAMAIYSERSEVCQAGVGIGERSKVNQSTVSGICLRAPRALPDQPEFFGSQCAAFHGRVDARLGRPTHGVALWLYPVLLANLIGALPAPLYRDQGALT